MLNIKVDISDEEGSFFNSVNYGASWLLVLRVVNSTIRFGFLEYISVNYSSCDVYSPVQKGELTVSV